MLARRILAAAAIDSGWLIWLVSFVVGRAVDKLGNLPDDSEVAEAERLVLQWLDKGKQPSEPPLN